MAKDLGSIFSLHINWFHCDSILQERIEWMTEWEAFIEFLHPGENNADSEMAVSI